MQQLQSQAVKLQTPYYGLDEGAQLHRYLHPDFVPRFQQDLARDALGSPAATAWLREDRISRHDRKPVLRLPIHRSFYLVSCEAVWDRLGCPPLDPQRIASAGFVIRRVGGVAEQAWMLQQGEPQGWKKAFEEAGDPDLYRRLCANGVLRQGDVSPPAYSGEETHPLHVLSARDAEGRPRTLLYGYVPLGGFHYLRTLRDQAPFDTASAREVSRAAAAQLPWPYGYRQPLNKEWLPEFSRPVDRGRPAHEWFELLRWLVQNHQLGAQGREGNGELEAWARGIHFYDVPRTREDRWQRYFLEHGDAEHTRYRRFSLWDYLQACFAVSGDNPLVAWIARQEKAISAAGGLDALGRLKRLPGKPAKLNDGRFDVSHGDLAYSLYLSAADAGELRQLLSARAIDLVSTSAREIPVPKFQQDAEDVYRIVPFVRVKDEAGRERITWAAGQQRSLHFRVAAPFDPEASRPSLIQMPSLGDLRRGLTKGASVITPPDTFKLINALKLGKGASEDVVPDETPSDGIGLQWICSFSLPVITLVAMILLMIMISLLNILFFWLPWVKVCLPFPKLK